MLTHMHHTLGGQSHLVNTPLMSSQLTLGVEHSLTFTAFELPQTVIASPVGLQTLLGVELLRLPGTVLTGKLALCVLQLVLPPPHTTVTEQFAAVLTLVEVDLWQQCYWLLVF